MKVAPATPLDIALVVHRMREQSAAEAFVSVANEDRHELARRLGAISLRATALFALAPDDGNEAIALVGVFEIAPRRGSMVFLATGGFPFIGGPAHRWWHRAFVPEVLEQNFRRVEFMGGADAASARWLTSLGFAREGIAVAYGKNGEDFGYWAWLHPEWRAGAPSVDAAGAALSCLPAREGPPPHV